MRADIKYSTAGLPSGTRGSMPIGVMNSRLQLLVLLPASRQSLYDKSRRYSPSDETEVTRASQVSLAFIAAPSSELPAGAVAAKHAQRLPVDCWMLPFCRAHSDGAIASGAIRSASPLGRALRSSVPRRLAPPTRSISRCSWARSFPPVYRGISWRENLRRVANA